MSKNLLAVYNLGHTRGQCSGIGNPVFVPAVDSRGRETPSFDGGTLLSACGLLDRVIHRSGRTPLLPLYAFLLFNAPEVLTLRTLYELPEFGGGAGRRRKENLQGVPQTVLYSRFVPLLPRGDHVLYFKGKFRPIFATFHRNKAHFLRKLYKK